MACTFSFSVVGDPNNWDSHDLKYVDGGWDPAISDGSYYMANLDAVLAERGKRYGEFMGHAEITQNLKAVMSQAAGWDRLKVDQLESLEMIVHKIGRILNGDPNWVDSWDDIAGYAKLVADRLRK